MVLWVVEEFESCARDFSVPVCDVKNGGPSEAVIA